MFKNLILIIVYILMCSQSNAEIVFTDKFNEKNEWNFITDQVMGGISTGTYGYEKINNDNILKINGNVSTKNNGGFIQVRRNLNNINLTNAKNVEVIAKGNNEKYFIHLRTNFTLLPWQYYQNSFTVKKDFKNFILPIRNFKKSGFLLPDKINPKNIKSIGIVAFGKDYKAELIVKEISFVR